MGGCEVLINDEGEMLAVVTIPDEHAGELPWCLKTCLYWQAIDTVYIALDYLDRIPGVKDLSPAELIETLDATRPTRAIPLQGHTFVPVDWMRETFPFEGVGLSATRSRTRPGGRTRPTSSGTRGHGRPHMY